MMSTDDEEAVIAANRALYRAFAAGDLAAMDALWAREKPVACIHPGGPVLESRAIILDSWAAIMTSPDRPTIQPQRVRAFLLGDIAFVTLYERLSHNCLAATNVFAREQGAWKLVLHQSGPGPAFARRDTAEGEPLVFH